MDDRALPLTAVESARLFALLHDVQLQAMRTAAQLTIDHRCPNAVALLQDTASLCADIRERLQS